MRTLDCLKGFAASARRLVAPALVLALTLVSSACATTGASQLGPSPRGADLRIIPFQGAELRGELLAVDETNLWVLENGGEIRMMPLLGVRVVRVPRHGHSGGRILTWTAVAGGLTTVAMIFACASVEDADGCPVFGLAWGGAWALAGGLSSLLIRPSQSIRLRELRGYARFPAGLPEGYRD